MNNKFTTPSFLFIILVCQTFSFCGGANKQRKKIGQYTVEAKFIQDSIIDGEARYYDSSNNLRSIVEYQMGEKEGDAVNYSANGILQDSIHYSNGLTNGQAFLFDSNGNISIKKYNYYGLTVGHENYYNHGKLIKYNFLDFDRNVLTSCVYDSSGRCKLSKFDPGIVFVDATSDDGQEGIDLFFYFPVPPGVKTIYKIGLTNERREIKGEVLIDHNRLFLDTLLPLPEHGWHYFISTQLESQKDSINTIYQQLLMNDSTRTEPK